MKYHVFSDNKSWVMVSLGTDRTQPYSVSTISPKSDDKFCLKKGIKLAVARLSNYKENPEVVHPATEIVAKLVFDIPVGLETYWVGNFVVENVLERLAKRLYSIFSNQYKWRNGRTIMWRTMDEIASFITVNKVKNTENG